MHLNRVIMPEIVLGRRGHPQVIEAYKHFMKGIHKVWNEEEKIHKWLIPAVSDRTTGAPDANLANHHLMCRLFRDNNGKVYYIGKDFAQALSKFDREIPIDTLPKKFYGYIQFAEGALQDDSGFVDGAFVTIATLEDMGYSKEEGDLDSDLGISISYGNLGKDPSMGSPTACKFASVLKRLHTVEHLYDSTAHVDDQISQELVASLIKGAKQPAERTEKIIKDLRLPVIRAIINTIVYIHSADPDLEKLAPLDQFSNKKRSEVRKTQSVENHLSVPVTLVGWKYHAANAYTVDQTKVSAHMRWQRCGVKNSQVKLIFINEHIRRYRKETQDEEPTDQSSGLTTTYTDSSVGHTNNCSDHSTSMAT